MAVLYAEKKYRHELMFSAKVGCDQSIPRGEISPSLRRTLARWVDWLTIHSYVGIRSEL